MSASEDERRFAEIAARSAAARATDAAVVTGSYQLCGETACVRVAGGSLAAAVLPALSHLRCALGDQAAPPLAIDLWDVRESRVKGLAGADNLASGRCWDLGDGTFAISADGRFVSHRVGDSVAWLDRRRACIAGWFADATALSLHQRGKPLQMLLAVRASDRGLAAVHAACVVHPNGAGILLPASGGAGKSTTSLACLRAGYSCLGDDWVGLSRRSAGAWSGHGLYSSLFFEPGHARLLGIRAADLVAPPSVAEEKHLLLASALFPGRLVAAARLCAVALPRFRPGSRATLRPASRAEVLLALVPSSVFTMRPRLDPDGVDRLATLVDEVPGYVLETGADLSGIPRCLDEILAAGSR